MQQGNIYRIICLCHPDINYVGSTLLSLRHRWQQHKNSYKLWLEGKYGEIAIYPYIKKYGLNQFKIILIKSYPVCDKHHLSSYEQLWFNKMKNIVCNHNMPWGVSSNNCRWLQKTVKKIYRETHKEQIKEHKKIYAESNKEYIETRRNAKVACICGRLVARGGKARHESTPIHIRLVAAMS